MAFFNQNTASFHNDDQTVNFGLGYRSLQNDDKLMLGANIFFDYSFDDAHQRNGAGIEAISSVFDLRANSLCPLPLSRIPCAKVIEAGIPPLLISSMAIDENSRIYSLRILVCAPMIKVKRKAMRRLK